MHFSSSWWLTNRQHLEREGNFKHPQNDMTFFVPQKISFQSPPKKKVHQKSLQVGFNNITYPLKEKSKKKHTKMWRNTPSKPMVRFVDPEKNTISLPLKNPQTDRESNSISPEPGCVGTARQAIEGLNSSRDQPSKALPGVSKSCSSPERAKPWNHGWSTYPHVRYPH